MTMQMMSVGQRALATARALTALLIVGVVIPVALGAAARSRFGGRQPLHGVPSPGRWRIDQLWSALTGELTQRTIVDVVVRTCLLVAWVAVIVFVVTVVVETAHMLRHAGHHLPDVRGLGWSQRGARAVASGLLALLPLVQPMGAVSASAGRRPLISDVAAPTVTASVDERGFELAPGPVESPAPPASTSAAEARSAVPGGSYVVRQGDSVYAIASQLAGGDRAAVPLLADRIVELNLGREMGSGERFTNAGYIDVGWVLQIPDDVAVSTAAGRPPVALHVVVPGESLWSIADDELGDPHLWPELYETNAGRRFDDGGVLDDPSVVRPGWELHLPDRPGEPATELEQAPVVEHAPRHDEAAVELHDAHHDDAVLGLGVEDAMTVADAVHDARPASPTAIRPENVWQAESSGESSVAAVQEPAPAGDGTDVESEVTGSEAPELITIRRAAMLSAGIMTLLAVRRRRRLRAALPAARLPKRPDRAAEASVVERAVRAGDVGGRFARVDLAVRAATMSLVAAGVRLLAARCSVDGDVELWTTGPAELPPMWNGSGERWTLPAAVPLEGLADEARRVTTPCPALVQLGVDEHGAEVYVDLETIGALEIGGPGRQADAIVAAIAATLASSVLAETTTLVSVGVSDDAFLDHRLHTIAVDADDALRRAAEAVGPVSAMESPIFELRARGTAGEQWAPAVVLIGPNVPDVRSAADVTGVALVSASPVLGPSSRLAPEGDLWVLRPAGIGLRPIGLVPDDISTIAALVNDDDTIYFHDDDPPADGAPNGWDEDHQAQIEPHHPDRPPAWDLTVRLFGPVEVVDRSGGRVAFERSKTIELVAWLVTHRDRSTRSNARTALWEQDVRDATFANVVSEARRALARLVPPPDGEEWVGRTLNEQLPLHPRVVSDADLLEQALVAVRANPTAATIDALRIGVESIAGLPFEGTSYLWPDAEGLTSHLVLLATSAAAELAGHCLSSGDVDGVFEATGRGLRVLPGHEELIALRMRAHAQAGDHAGVRQEWNSYERVINADAWSDGEPSPKLVHLRKQLLHPGV